MQISVLGHLELSVDDHPVALGGIKQRAVLAMLGLEANRPVTADRLIEGLWGEQPPASAAKMVQNYVWRLRGALPVGSGAEIVTRGRAYELQIDRELVDVCRLERLVSEAARGESNDAAREALALFRGEPLADVADEPFANAEIRRLEELRLTASELAIDADLAAGRHHDLAVEIDALLASNPLRERLHAQRMLALYRCGRQAEALEAYRHARETLVEQIGVEPAPELRRLHDAILRQDAALDVEPAATELPRELDLSAAPPLIGRESQLQRMRACWQRAGAGAGALLTVAGAYGMGKTRLAAEIAGDAQREGADVRYIAGTGPSEAVLAALARTRESRRPSLLVVDDADRAAADVRAALRELGQELAPLPVLVLATGLQAAALERLEPLESLVLEPLDARSVRAIAGLYAPAGGGEVPVEALLATSGGVPRRVHQAASEWARQEAMRRVDEAAGRAASDRSEARASETALADSVVELQSTRELADVAGAPVVCPYKGLATFEREDVEYFFGRERLVAELVARLVGGRLLAVVGPSGSGKSSVVKAGLLPALAGGVLPGSDTWVQAVMRPGSQPLRELRRVTRKLAREWKGVLAIDQFEELFTACQDEDERREFVAALVHAARDDARVVVLAIRADFYGRCAAYPELSRLLGADHVLVGPMSREELRCAIERPAQRVGLSVDPELVDALLADVEGRPGALPLLSTALLELWRERDGRRLRLAAYARSGGVEGAVARLAEEAYLQLDPPQQAATRTLMLQLADEDESGAIVRRRIPLSEVDADVVTALAEQRLLTVGDGAVEVAHEALLREWPRLRVWLDDDVEGRRLHRRLGTDARAWDADARDAGGLYRGARLAATLDWAAEHEPELSPTERAFLDEGRRASGRAQRRVRMVLAGVASLLVLAVIAGVVALDQRHTARAAATAADAQRLGAQALSDDDLDRGLLLARQGVALHDSLQTRGNLFAALLKSPAAIGVLHGDRLSGVALSPDGRTVAFTDGAGRLHFVDTRTRRAAAPPQVISGMTPGIVGNVVNFNNDGTRVAVGGSQPVILDARTHRVVVRLPVDPLAVYRLMFSPDGHTLFAAIDSIGPGRRGVERFDVRSGRSLGPLRHFGRGVTPPALAITHDGARLITSVDGGQAVIRDARTLRPLKRLAAEGTQLALSPDDRTLLVGGGDGTVRFVDLVTGEVRIASGRHEGAVIDAQFSGDGRTAVTTGEDNRALVWDVAHATARDTLAGHSGQISGMAIARDGRTLYTSSLDGKVLIWDLAGDRRLGRPFSTGGQLSEPDYALVSFALRPDGRALAFGHADGTVTLVDPRTLRPRSTFRAVPSGSVGAMTYMPGGRLLLVSSDDGFVGLVDPARERLVRRLPDGLSSQTDTYVDGDMLASASFSADRRLMAVANGDSVAVWALKDGLPVGHPRSYYGSIFARAAVLSPDGRTVVVVSPVDVAIVDVASLRRRAVLPRAASVIFTPDGRYLAAGGFNGSSQLWSTRTWRPVGRPLAGHTDDVYWQSVSPDSRTLATGSADGTIRLYDVRTQTPLGAPLPGMPNHATAPQFTPDGAQVFAVTNADRAYRWDVRPAAWARHACAVAGRALTRAEWSTALPGRDYAPACAR